MFFLNFGLAQFLMIAGAASLATVALYLLDRSRSRQVVSTLRFWTPARQTVQTSRRRKLRQPWSLALQLLGILLLLLAIAQPRIGDAFAKPREHVLILETSAWMDARSDNGTLMDRARSRALRWLTSLPSGDPVMLVRADALATPATAFETDHTRVASAITASMPGATALDIDSALRFARRAQALQNGPDEQNARGEIAFVGTGRIDELPDSAKSQAAESDRGLRVLLINDAIPNAGLRRVNARRATADRSRWDVLVTLRNYGGEPEAKPRAVNLVAGFDQAPIGTRTLLLPPGVDREASFTFHSRSAGVLDVRLSPDDAFPQDDRATLVIPALPDSSVTVYTTRPEILRPFFTANPGSTAQFRTPAQYRDDGQGLVVFDRFSPAARPGTDAIWIDPQAGASPIPVVTQAAGPRTLVWDGNTPLGAGLRAHDIKVFGASVLSASAGDIRAASIAEGPVVVARPGPHKMVVIGFDPGSAALRFELSTPLAFANILAWIEPETFAQSDVNVQTAGSVSTAVEGETSSGLQVTREDGAAVPFTMDRHTLRFFSGARENVRVTGSGRDSSYALTLPEMGVVKWQPPPDALRGTPRQGTFAPHNEIWPWLAVLGALCLAADWIFFSGTQRTRLKPVALQAPLRRAS